jgi:hypothetical protein
MEVVSYGPSFYFLIKDDENYYLDVNCTVRFAGFCMTFELNEEEIALYKKRGESFINELAEKVNRLSNTYQARQLGEEKEKKVNDAIMEWNNANKP